MHEFSSQHNHQRLMESIDQVNKDKTFEVEYNEIEIFSTLNSKP